MTQYAQYDEESGSRKKANCAKIAAEVGTYYATRLTGKVLRELLLSGIWFIFRYVACDKMIQSLSLSMLIQYLDMTRIQPFKVCRTLVAHNHTYMGGTMRHAENSSRRDVKRWVHTM